MGTDVDALEDVEDGTSTTTVLAIPEKLPDFTTPLVVNVDVNALFQVEVTVLTPGPAHVGFDQLGTEDVGVSTTTVVAGKITLPLVYEPVSVVVVVTAPLYGLVTVVMKPDFVVGVSTTTVVAERHYHCY